MSKVKNVLIKLDLVGNGIVNFDSPEQKFMFNGSKLHNMKTGYNNVNYAKKNFYKDEEGNLSYKLKISSNCLRHEIFNKDILAHSSNIIHHPHLLNSYIASPVSILRGYTEGEKGGDNIKRKSPLSISSAEQTNNSISYLELQTRSGEKNQDPNEVDNTLFKKESVGTIEYSTIGNIDLMYLQFISCDQVFDRYSFNPDYYEIYKGFLKTHLPMFDSELGYYQLATSVIEIPEYGIKLNNETIVELVKGALSRILQINIMRANGFAKTSKLEYKLVYDVIEDNFNSEDGWVTVNSMKDIESLNFEVQDFYVQEDTQKAIEKREFIEAKLAEAKQRKAEEKKLKAEQAKAAKAKAAKAKDNKK